MLELKVGDKVFAYDNYCNEWLSDKDAITFAVTTITKIDESKGWYYTPLGKFKLKGTYSWDLDKLKSVSTKGEVFIHLDPNKLLVEKQDYTIYNMGGYSGFTANYIIPFNDKYMFNYKNKYVSVKHKKELKDSRLERTKPFKDKLKKLLDKLDEEYATKEFNAIRTLMCGNCIFKDTCEAYNNGGYTLSCSTFDVEAE